MRAIPWFACAALLTACASDNPAGFQTSSGGVGGATGHPDGGTKRGTTSGAGANGGGSSGGYSGTAGQNSGGVGGSVGGTSGNALGGSNGCSPAGLTPCGAGLVCDQSMQACRLPSYGETCDPAVGCATQPPGMTCTEANFAGSSEELCLVACSATDSSPCPYGTSCGDPDLPGYCSPSGPGTCTPWMSCSLGGSLTGLCVPNGQTASCIAAGSVVEPFAACNPQTTNADATDLCAGGMICLAASAFPPTMGAAPAQTGGFCVPPCTGDQPNAGGAPACSAAQHCVATPGSSVGFCLPGSGCSLDGMSRACPVDWWCLPDSLDGASGGCVESIADAGMAGDPCQQPVDFTTQNPCMVGNACLQNASGGASCETVCLLAVNTSVGYGCTLGTCTAATLGSGDAGPALGVCE